MNTQKYTCQHCGVECPTVLEVLLHVYCEHNHNGEKSIPPKIAEVMVDEAVSWMEWHNRLGTN